MANEIGKMHFRRMDEGTDADFAVLARVHEENIRKLPDLVLGILTDLKGDEAYPVDRLQHSLQTATRALRDGRDEEYVVCALLHDIGESLGRESRVWAHDFCLSVRGGRTRAQYSCAGTQDSRLTSIPGRWV